MEKYHTLKTILVDRLGRVPAGKVVELTKAQGNIYLAQGAVERYETKVIRQDPLPHAGVVIQSSALPVEEALPETTLKPVKKQYKKKTAKKPASSQTPVSD